MVGITQFAHIGKHAYIAGQSGIEKDVPPFVIVVGSRPSIIKGANLVGLKRKNLALETIQQISEAIKLWSRSNLLKDDCLAQISALFEKNEEVKEFVAFIRKSNGVVR
jgi:UDP-N-acetylglucosamine acyltransferase